MSGRIHKSRIPVTPQKNLSPEVRDAIGKVKNTIKDERPLKLFGNKRGEELDGPPLPQLSNGCSYYEFQVGKAHDGDSRRKGRRRLVVELHDKSRRIMTIYYTIDHYAKFSFVRAD